MMTALDVTSSSRGDGTVRLRLSGELDMSTGSQLDGTLRVVERNSPAQVIVDLSGLAFMDSTGLNLLLQAELRARQAGWKLVLVRGPDWVQRVFKIARLEDRLTFIDDPLSDGGTDAA